MTTITTLNPATGNQLGCFERIVDAELERRIAVADRAQKQWRMQPLEQRSALLRAVAGLYRERAEELARDISLEMGKPYKAALGEISLVISIFEYYAEHAGKMLETRDLDVFGSGTAKLRKDPIGVLLGIMPWNFPHYQVARFVAPNLMLGNTTIIKHASISAQSGQNIADIFAAAGAAEGIYTNIFAGHSQIESMVADPRIKGVSLTGSDAAGERIGALAGKHIKPCVLELGGSDPFIVLADADLEQAAKAAVIGRCNNAGQQCTGAKRFIIEAPVYDKFVELFVKGMERVVVGDPFDEATEMGSLSSPEALQELEEQVTHAVEDGAHLLTGGQRLEREGAYFPPTVLANVEPGNRAYYQELFGPVAMVFKVGSVTEAIDLANDSPYGLSSAVFTRNEKLAEQIGEELETGMVYINSVSKSSAELPFGGVKRSGVGRELGPLGIDEFANLKLIRQP